MLLHELYFEEVYVMKIGYLTTIPGTLRAFVVPQVEAFHKKHPEIEIKFISSSADHMKEWLPDFVEFISVPMSRGIDFGAVKSIIALKKLFKKEKFDMIIYATPNAALYSSLAGKMAKVKKRLYCQWGIRYVGFSGIKRKLFKYLEKVACKNSTHINAVSTKNRQFAIDEKLYKSEKATVVGNGGTVGVDLSAYDMSKYNEYREEKRKELGIEQEFVFGFVGRLSRDKGSLELFRSTKKMSEQNENFKLVCVGRSELSEKDFPADIKEWAECGKNVILTGLKPKEEVVKYYAAFDCYVHPTYREGFGMVLQEAGAMGCPVITTDIPGAGEVLVDGESCLLCKPRDTESLIECMQKLVNDREYAESLGKNARKYVEEKYERNSMVENHIKRYEELLEV